MTELKLETLNELEYFKIKDITPQLISKDDLRRVAIKWIKSDSVILGSYGLLDVMKKIKYPIIRHIQHTWIQYFFNIKNEDLK